MQYGSRFLVCLEKSMQNGVCSAYCIGKGGRDTRDCNMNAHRIHIAADYRKANQAEYKRKKRKPLKTQRFTLSCITESMGFEPTKEARKIRLYRLPCCISCCISKLLSKYALNCAENCFCLSFMRRR